MLYPAPELPDDTPVENVRFATRIRNALNVGGMKTIGEVTGSLLAPPAEERNGEMVVGEAIVRRESGISFSRPSIPRAAFRNVVAF